MSRFVSTLVFCLLVFLVCVDARRNPNAVSNAPKRHLRAVDNLANADHNGVVTSSLGHYFIYYGSQFGTGGSDEATPAGVKQYCTDLSGSEYLNIMTQYYGKTDTEFATRYIHWAGATIVGAPYGLTLSDEADRCVLKVLERLLLDPQYNIPFNTSNQYYVILGSDVTVSNAYKACGDDGACGLHNQQTIKINGKTSPKFLSGWVGSSVGCIGSQVSALTGPAANAIVQSVLDTLSHEVSETITDPNQLPSSDRAWQDSQGSEIGDKCYTDYGTPKPSTKVPNAYYNVLANGNEYMLQSEWSNEISGCTLARTIVGQTPSPSASLVAPSSGAPAASASSSGVPASASQSAPGASASGAALPSVSNVASPSASPSTFGKLPTDGCIICGNGKCYRDKKFKKICENKLGGTDVNTTTKGERCCTGISKFTSYSWTVGSPSCSEIYEVPYRKLQALCDSIGGRTTCSLGTSGAVRLTCNRG